MGKKYDDKLRKMFNALRSTPCVEAPVYIENRTVKAERL